MVQMLSELKLFKFVQRAKEGREPTKAEIFVESRKGNKGKQVDVEIEKAILCKS